MGNDVKKNLIYFIYFNGSLNYYHMLNLEFLRNFWNVFDGDRVVKIAVDSDYSTDDIVNLLPDGCKYQIVKNDPQNGEAIHFLESLNLVNGGITFYAHCKGVTRPRLNGLDMWINKLYNSNLTKVPDMSGKLFSGVCGKILPCPPFVPEPFHYSGSFYWFDTEKVKPRVVNLQINKYLTERFPSMVARYEECLFGYPTERLNTNYYAEETWRRL
jgi:hypothetical protein